MIHSRHYITKCRICDKLLAQCRCMGVNKDLTYATCNECAAKGIKALFLDIDGVCNSEKHFQGSNEIFGIDPYMAFLVGKIVIDTGCVIVLSSTWRHSEEGIKHVEKRVHKLYGVTPRSAHGFRGDEVKAYLAEHPEITRYAILDDDLDFHGFQPLFKTTWKNGLTPDIAEAVTNYLNEEENAN